MEKRVTFVAVFLPGTGFMERRNRTANACVVLYDKTRHKFYLNVITVTVFRFRVLSSDGRPLNRGGYFQGLQNMLSGCLEVMGVLPRFWGCHLRCRFRKPLH